MSNTYTDSPSSSTSSSPPAVNPAEIARVHTPSGPSTTSAPHSAGAGPYQVNQAQYQHYLSSSGMGGASGQTNGMDHSANSRDQSVSLPNSAGQSLSNSHSHSNPNSNPNSASNSNPHPGTSGSTSDDILRRMAGGMGVGMPSTNGNGSGTSLRGDGRDGHDHHRHLQHQQQLEQQRLEHQRRTTAQLQIQQAHAHAQAQAHAQAHAQTHPHAHGQHSNFNGGDGSAHTNGNGSARSGINGHGQSQTHGQPASAGGDGWNTGQYGYGGGGYGRYGGESSGKGYDGFPPFIPAHDPYNIDHLHALGNPSSDHTYDPLHIDALTAAAVAGDTYINPGHGLEDPPFYGGGDVSGQGSRMGSGASSVNGGSGRGMVGSAEMAHLYASLHRNAVGGGSGGSGSAPPSRPHSAQGGQQFPPYYAMPRHMPHQHEGRSSGAHTSSFGSPIQPYSGSPSTRHSGQFDPGMNGPPSGRSGAGGSGSVDASMPMSGAASPYGSPLGSMGFGAGSAANRKSKYTRSRTGCLACRTKRVKCDETRPVCKRCVNAKRDESECVFPGLADLPKSTIKALAAAAAATAEAEGRPYQSMEGLNELLASGGSGVFKRRRASQDEIEGDSKRSRTDDDDISSGGHKDSTFHHHGPELMQHYMQELQQTLAGPSSRANSPGMTEANSSRRTSYGPPSRDSPGMWDMGIHSGSGRSPVGAGGGGGGGMMNGPGGQVGLSRNGHGDERHFRQLSTLLAPKKDAS